MQKQASLVVSLMLLASTVACDGTREAMNEHQQVVARVDGYALTVDHAAQLLSHAAEGVAPALPVVVDPLVDYWVGYTLLAIEYTNPDTFANVDIDAIIQEASDQELVWQLHDEVIMPQIVPPEPQFREQYERERPFDRVRAQHILVSVPGSATPEQADSLQRVAGNIRARLLAGEDFRRLAERFSDDPATAGNGGDLGWVRRDQLLPGLEDALFELEPGVASETVRSPVGYHIVRIIDRHAPPFEEAETEYRAEQLEQRLGDIETEYLTSLLVEKKTRLAPGAVSLVRELVSSPRLERLSSTERAAALATYEGGTLTAGDVADFVIRGWPGARVAFLAPDSADLEGVLRRMVQSKLLAQMARDEGYELTRELADSLRDDAQRELFTAAYVAGFTRDQLSGEGAIMLAVDRALTEVLRRERSPEPLHRLMPALRGGHLIQVYPARFRGVAARLAELRSDADGVEGQAAVPVPPGLAARETEGRTAEMNRNR